MERLVAIHRVTLTEQPAQADDQRDNRRDPELPRTERRIATRAARVTPVRRPEASGRRNTEAFLVNAGRAGGHPAGMSEDSIGSGRSGQSQ